MTREDCWPVCMFCQTRFTLAPGTEPTRCESWRSPDGTHAERRTATPEQHAWLRIEKQPEAGSLSSRSIEGTKSEPAPTPFDAAALRAGVPSGQTSLF